MITKKELNDEIINETNTDYDNINLIGFKKSPILETKRNFNLAFIIKMTIMAALGGFLFGYDTGVIGGASLYFYMDFPNITPSEKETIVSLTVIGAAGGCVLIGPILDNYGRKLTIIISDLLFIVGAILVYIF